MLVTPAAIESDHTRVYTDGGEEQRACARALARVHQQIEALAGCESEVSKELYATLQAGAVGARVEALRSERRRLRAVISQLTDTLPELEQAVEQARRAEHVPSAESLTAQAQQADRRRSDALGELDGSVLHAFAKLEAFERAQRQVERTRARAEDAWVQAGLNPLAARRRVNVTGDPPYDVLGHHGGIWMRSVLRYLRAARLDFMAWRKP
jgi:chromosome segregation ATPase